MYRKFNFDIEIFYLNFKLDSILIRKLKFERILLVCREEFISNLYYKTISKLKMYIKKKNLFEALISNYLLLNTINYTDYEMRNFILEDIKSIENKLSRFKTKNELNSKSTSIIIEIRSGVGGIESNLFVDLLYKMYQKYALKLEFKIKVLDLIPGEVNGLKHIYLSVTGYDTYIKFKHESGVHRIQRVPSTESNGRIHTSTATVAVLPEAKEVDLSIEERDLKITVCRASGPGGQGVNTTDSAVQIIHKPTNIIVTCANQRTQQKNKSIALDILKAKLFYLKKNEIADKYSCNRRTQISNAQRSSRIRTYNFLQNRVTDHRINFSSKAITDILNGNLDIITSNF